MTESEGGEGGAVHADGEPSVLTSSVAWEPNFPRIRRLDDLWYRGERMLCGVMFLLMTLLVFVAVLNEKFGARQKWSDAFVLFGLVYLGTRTRTVREGETRMSQAVSLGVSAGITVGLSLLVVLFAKPGGWVFAQKLALVMMLWVALLGASMATYERAHLSLEMGEKIWPRRFLHVIKAFAHALTSACCLVLFLLSVHMVREYMGWGQVIEANEWLPRWVAVLIMAYVFGAMSVRFAAQAVTVALKKQKPPQEQLPT